MITTSDLIMIGLAFLIGYLDDIYGPQPYYYNGKIVIVDKKYQCPTYCGVNHNHSVYFNSQQNGMVIDKNQLGKKFKEKKIRQKK